MMNRPQVWNPKLAAALDQALPNDHASTYARLESLARLMDSAVRIPGTNVTVGLDALLGLAPVVGNIGTTVISTYLILEARRLGVPKLTLVRMAGNVGLDALISAVPVLGNVADVFFKANRRNVRILQQHLHAKRNASRG